jgi:hypothetical protein
MSISRRQLLIGGGGLVVLGVIGTGAALFAPWPRLTGRKFLTPTEAGVALALAEVLFDEPGLPSPAQIDLLRHLDEGIGGLHPTTRKLFRTGLRALEYSTLPISLSRFSQLPLERRKAAVRRFEKKPYLMSQLMLSLRFQVGQAWFESPAGLSASGWRLGCVPSGSEG